ncbi:MAG: hypothetical protein ACJA0H_000457 [Francisellaceae bacterium]
MFKTAPSQPKLFKVMFSSCQKALSGAGKDDVQNAWGIAYNNGKPICDINVLSGDTH